MKTGRSVLLAATVSTLSPTFAFGQSMIEKNVVVGMYSGLALTMDVHRPENSNGLGIVHISGSGWMRPLAYDAEPLSESQVDVYGQPLVQRGYTVFSLNHRATPRFRFPAPLEDVQRAVRFVRYHAAEYGIDPDRIGAIGGSSGGHLSAMLGVMDGRGDPDDPDPVNRVSAKVQTVVARAPLTDLARIETPEGIGFVVLLMGARPSPNAHTAEGRAYFEASPVNHVSADDPPTLFIHGDRDGLVPFEQSELLSRALDAVGVETRLIRIPEGDHGPTFPGAVDPPDYIGAIIDWFDRHLGR